MTTYRLNGSNIRDTRLLGGFWKRIDTMVKRELLPFQWKALNDELPGAAPSHCVENFRIAAGESQGEYYGLVFQDSDLAKWLEAACYAMITQPDPELLALVDSIIDLIGRAQQEDGYLNTHYIVKEPQNRWTNLKECHELYCAGHMMEAAVAHHEATGSVKFLDIMMRTARHIDSVFGRDDGKRRGYCGHPEIELALMRMYHATGERFLFNLAKYFIDERGQSPDYYEWEEQQYHQHRHHTTPTLTNRKYDQHHAPVREQEALEGHCVRGLYLLCGMADVAAESGDEALMRAAQRLFDSATRRRMYVTGGVGSSHFGESFTLDYDLPNDTAYQETCASIALIFAASRLFRARPFSFYGDIIERALYNTCLAGMSLDGKSFFYVNPLEVDPQKSERDPGKAHTLPHRPEWFGCACCPPNLARLIASLGAYIYGSDERSVYVNQYMDSEAALTVAGRKVSIAQRSGYPYEGCIHMKPLGGAYRLMLRIPDWCARFTVFLNGQVTDTPVDDGFVRLEKDWQDGDEVELNLAMDIRRVYANPCVSEDVGMVAIQRGPLVYCLEQVDNRSQLHRFRLPRNAEGSLEYRDDLGEGIIGIAFDGEYIEDAGNDLYRMDEAFEISPARLRMIPYYAWANRAPGEMRVWLHQS